MKKILILGGSGFIGRNLAEYLYNYKSKYVIYTPTSRELNLLDEKQVGQYLSSQYFDVVVNAAVYNPRTDSQKDPSRELECDLRLFYNLERYQEHYGKMLYLGSGAEFDKSGNLQQVPDNYEGNGIPTNCYGFAKYIIAKEIRNSINIYNLRIFGLFGKYENWKATFISGACCKAIKGLPITIRQNVYFDYLYIDDFCKIIEWFIDHTPTYKEYNVTSGQRIDLISIAEIIREKSGKQLPIIVCNEGLGNEYTAINKRITEELKHLNLMPIDTAITKLYAWYETQQDKIDLYSLLYQ